MEKELYKKDARQKLDDILSKMEEMKKRKNNISDKDIQKEYEKSIAELEPKIKKLHEQYEALESKAEETWKDIKEDYELNVKVLQDCFSHLLF